VSPAEEIQNVLITGGTDGLGRAAAILLAENGYNVFAAGRSAGKRAALQQLARERGLPLGVVELDVCDDDSVSSAVDSVRARGGQIDALINNAGVGIIAAMEEVRMEDLRKQFETNFFGAVRLIQAVLPEMRQRRRGRIINMSSISGKVVIPLFGPYSSSKFALESMTDALRLETHPFGVHVALIEPGYIPTGFETASRELSSTYAAGAAASPYAVVYEGFRRQWKHSTRPKEKPEKPKAPATTPEDCARVILRALRDTPPRARYTVTRSAWVGSLMKRIVPDGMLDRQMIRRFGLKPEAR
jgi:NAD(P)-dependent dehydrogenase (short-subunit alcohol dehydrogenase family)